MANAAYDPAVMAALYLYSYCVGERSSRKIEKNCLENVPFRIISGDLHPDHSTISRFRKKFQKELADLFVQVLVFCREAGLCDLSTVSVDRTKIKANTSLAANQDEKGLEREIRKCLEEAEVLDAQEDALTAIGAQHTMLDRIIGYSRKQDLAKHPPLLPHIPQRTGKESMRCPNKKTYDNKHADYTFFSQGNLLNMMKKDGTS